jgi:MoaA/NifB/PqqE/SkfB family radical SAM enzyme
MAVPAGNHEATFYLRTSSLGLTSNCNLRCTYCGLSLPSYRGITMSEREIELAIQGLREMRAGSVALNGHGETTTVPNWYQAIGPIASQGSRLHLTSNFARTFSEMEIDALLAFTSVIVSFDTDDADLLKKTRRSVRLETIVDNLGRLQRAAASRRLALPKLVASCVVHTHNVMHLDRYVRFCATHGFRSVQFANLVEFAETPGTAFRVAHVGSLPREELVAARAKIREAQSVALALRMECEIQSGLLDFLDQSTEMSKPVGTDLCGEMRYAKRPEAGQTRNCLDPWFFAMIRADASVMPCCYHPVVGSLKQQSLSGVLNGEAAVALRRQLMTGALCDSCMCCPSRPIVGLGEFRAIVQKEIPPNWAAGMLVRAGLLAQQVAGRVQRAVKRLDWKRSG